MNSYISGYDIGKDEKRQEELRKEEEEMKGGDKDGTSNR